MNRFTIENKAKFNKYFLEPLAKLNPKCVLCLNKQEIKAKTSYPDSSLFLQAVSVIDSDIENEIEIAFIDLFRLIKILDFIQKDVVTFKIDSNFLSYKDSTNQFAMHIYDPKVISKTRISFEKIKNLTFDLDFNFNISTLVELLRASGIYPDLTKLYFSFKNNNLQIELTDKTKNINDSFTKTIENLDVGNKNLSFILPLEAFRTILNNKIDQLKFKFEKTTGLVNLSYETDGISMSYVVPSLIK